MAQFEIAEAKTGKIEGKWVNNPLDAGKETYAGISRKFHPSWEGWKLIDEYKTKPGFPENIDHKIMDPLVSSFYKKNFWDSIRLSEFNDQEIANEVYDTGVNMGPEKSIMILQEACNLLNNRQKLYKDIDVDGAVGKDTLGTVNNHPDKKLLFNLLNMLQAERYIEICRKIPDQETFMKGWLNKRVIYVNN